MKIPNVCLCSPPFGGCSQTCSNIPCVWAFPEYLKHTIPRHAYLWLRLSHSSVCAHPLLSSPMAPISILVFLEADLSGGAMVLKWHWLLTFSDGLALCQTSILSSYAGPGPFWKEPCPGTHKQSLTQMGGSWLLLWRKPEVAVCCQTLRNKLRACLASLIQTETRKPRYNSLTSLHPTSPLTLPSP